MLYKKRRRSGPKTGHYRFQGPGSRTMFGYGDGDFIRLKDEQGKEWRGIAEVFDQDLVRFRFRDEDGNYASGVSDSSGSILLRDERGNSWRGFVD
jgi:hypothetical protein